MRNIFLLFISLLTGIVGIKAADIRFEARRPAIIDVPSSIQSIAIIDRSIQTKATRNVLEESVTGELFGEDKIASQYAIDGLIEMLESSGRFNVVRTAKKLQKSSSANEFASPLAWDEIENICSEFEVDAVISLELFDSDYIIPTNMAFVSIGFRLYDPESKQIFDQHKFRHEIMMGGHVNSIAGAINRLVEKTQAIRRVSYDAGYLYGERIAPSWYTIVRQYYRKGKCDQNLKSGARMMEVNDWEQAIQFMNSTVETGKRKAKGRAAHNLAVIYEIKGELPEAKKWAQTAWGNYNNKNSRNYAYVLEDRIREVEILKAQDQN